MTPGRVSLVLCLLLLMKATVGVAAGEPVRRLVVIKADGLPHDLVDQIVRERDPRTGKSRLPWIEHVFYQRGTRMANFYVRGTSLSGPSWSLLETGQPLQVKGNVEFDRYTQHPYDYLNFIPFWLNNARGHTGDMWGTTVLDGLRLPILLDSFEHEARLQSFQLFQRGARWLTLQNGLKKRITTRSPKEIFDEWQVGFEMRGIIAEQLERELIAGLDNPRMEYLDYYTTDVDHDAHHNRDRATHIAALRELDAVIGRIWTAISRSALAPYTAMVLLSDHGVNTDPRYYSQGFSLVDLLTARTGGGHHVVTKRRILTDYSIKGVYPLVPLITTASPASPYLKGRHDDYPTALVDFDGNERASIHLRDSTLNGLQILLEQLQRRDLAPAVRQAAATTVLATIERHREEWTQISKELKEELDVLRAATAVLSARVLPKEEPREKDPDAIAETGEQRDQRLREIAHVKASTREDLEYTAYLQALDRLLALTPETLATPLIVKDYIAPHAMGSRNTLHELQNYVTGLAAGGLVLHPDGSLDADRSFTRTDYFALLTGARVRNNVQRGVSNVPIDMVALRVPCGGFVPDDGDVRAETCLWLNRRADQQALLLSRTGADGRAALRYIPIANLVQDSTGVISFQRRPWGPGLPLLLWEDPQIELPAGAERSAWLSAWHSDHEWLPVVHRSRYSNGIVGLHEQLVPHAWPALDVNEPGIADAERLRRRYRQRQRALVEPDILIMASDHWNFDVRGFNPGGNHGSFFRPSTHSTFMIAGGDATGIARGLEVTTPYDSLSYVPTILELMGKLEAGGEPIAALRERGFRRYAGPVVSELVAPRRRDVISTGP